MKKGEKSVTIRRKERLGGKGKNGYDYYCTVQVTVRCKEKEREKKGLKETVRP